MLQDLRTISGVFIAVEMRAKSMTYNNRHRHAFFHVLLLLSFVAVQLTRGEKGWKFILILLSLLKHTETLSPITAAFVVVQKQHSK